MVVQLPFVPTEAPNDERFLLIEDSSQVNITMSVENRDLDEWFLNSLGNNQVDPITALEEDELINNNLQHNFSLD